MIGDCSRGYQGQCCCNCEFQRPVVGHPDNEHFPSNRISHQFGYVCLMPEFFPKVVFMESKHGICECWTERDYEKYNKNHTFEALGE